MPHCRSQFVYILELSVRIQNTVEHIEVADIHKDGKQKNQKSFYLERFGKIAVKKQDKEECQDKYGAGSFYEFQDIFHHILRVLRELQR